MTADDWRGAANCATADPELFFPESSDTRAAKKVCAECAVTAECLAYALLHGYYKGVWGGLSGKERRALRRAAA